MATAHPFGHSIDLGQRYTAIARVSCSNAGYAPPLGGEFMAKPLLRRLLRKFGNIEMWWVEYGSIPREQWPTVRYVVSAGDSERTFDRPHEAWTYFRELTGPKNEASG